MVIQPSYFLPPISWFVNLVADEPTAISASEHFRKQTLRNRCYIDSPNGRLALTVPVDRSSFRVVETIDANGCPHVTTQCAMQDVQISNHTDWQRQHWYALESSYFNSPFFEYLQDDFRPIYLNKWKYLLDLNEALTAKCCELIDLHPPVRLMHGDAMTAVAAAPLPEYYQVFANKHGFLSDLSIVDLIFNLGPESVLYLQKLAKSIQ